MIVIDQFGVPADTAFRDLDVPVVEDAACALGASFADGRPCGSLGLASTISFHPRKLLTTGEGGVIVTDDDALAGQLRAKRNHGQAAPGEFVAVGLNHRLTEIQGALGEVQMMRLREAVRLRREHAAAIREGLGDLLSFQEPPEAACANEQTLGARLPEHVDPSEFLQAARQGGLGCGRLSYVLHRAVPACRDQGPFPQAERLEARGIALPLFPQMTVQEREQVIAITRKVLA